MGIQVFGWQFFSFVYIMSKSNKGKPEIPVFISKLVRMVEDNSIEEFISWNQSEDGFQIPNVPQFTDKVLPKYFKHRNFSSFVRQLNMYGFTKIRNEHLINQYRQPFFIRGDLQQIKKIQRKINANNQEQGLQLALNEPNHELRKQVEKIRRNQLQLQQKFMELFEENQMLFQQNQKLIKRMKEENQGAQLMLTLLPQLAGNDLQEKSILGQSEEKKKSQPQNDEEQLNLSLGNEEQNFLSLNDFANIDQQLLSIDSNELQFQN